MYREGEMEGEEEDECMVEWRKMERRRMEGRERSSRVMDVWEDAVAMEGCRKKKQDGEISARSAA